MGAQNRELGWAAGLLLSEVHGLPVQSSSSFPLTGMSFSRPSHQKPPSDVSATLVKIVLLVMVAIAFGLLSIDVPVDGEMFKPNDGCTQMSDFTCPSGCLRLVTDVTIRPAHLLSVQPSVVLPVCLDAWPPEWMPASFDICVQDDSPDPCQICRTIDILVGLSICLVACQSDSMPVRAWHDPADLFEICLTVYMICLPISLDRGQPG